MTQKNVRIYGITIILMVLSLACKIGLPGSAGNSDSSKPTVTPKTIQVKLPGGLTLGESYRSEVGGFAMSKINGLEFTDESRTVTFSAKDANLDTGPEIALSGGMNPTTSTNEEQLDRFKTQANPINISNKKAVTVDGKSGLSANLEYSVDGTPVKGKIVIVMVTPYQLFMQMGLAPAERWDKEMAPVFEAVLKTVTFFPVVVTPQADIPEPTVESAVIEPTATIEKIQPTLDSGKTQTLRQWAKSAVASSQYGNVNWAASQATGEPDTLECGDHSSAWASASSNTLEWIELTYETPVYPSEINIIQSYNPSQVTEVFIVSTTGEEYLVMETQPERIDICPDGYNLTFSLKEKVAVNRVRLTIDQRASGSWNEIDAVELVGTPAGDALPPQNGQPKPTVTTAATLPNNNPAKTGSFTYQITGAGENTTVSGGTMQYQSTSQEYVIGMVSSDQRYVVSLFLPLNVAPGAYPLKSYNKSSATANPSSAVLIGVWFYYAQGGSIKIEAVEGTLISGSFTFTAVHQEDPTKIVTVSGNFNKIPLK